MLSNTRLIESVWITAHIGDRLVGCGIFLRDNEAGCLKLLGLDYRVPYVYFQLLYEGIRCAIDTGCRVLWGGSGAYELKYRLGFQPYYNNYQVFAAGNRWLQWVARHVMGGQKRL
jgi:hypothetical protein